MKKEKKYTEIFEITEKPVPLKILASENDKDTLKVVEQDIRGMMHRIADLEFELSEKEKQNTEKTKRLLLSIIEVLDAFYRVFRNIRAKQDKVNPQMKKWIGNFRTVRRMLNNILAEQGVSAIENLDNGFDPHWHKVGEFVVDHSKSNGTIVDEILKGYVWHNQILRKSEASVVRNTEDPIGKSNEENDNFPIK